MHHGPTDTDPAAEAAQIELLREASVPRRLDRMHSLTRTTLALSRRAIRRRMPGATEQDVLLAWADLHYGKELADRVRQYLARREP